MAERAIKIGKKLFQQRRKFCSILKLEGVLTTLTQASNISILSQEVTEVKGENNLLFFMTTFTLHNVNKKICQWLQKLYLARNECSEYVNHDDKKKVNCNARLRKRKRSL